MLKSLPNIALTAVLSLSCHSAATAQQRSAGETVLAAGSTVGSGVLGGSPVASGSQANHGSVVQSDVLPPDFRGEITYYGGYSGSLRTRADRMRNLSVTEALRSVTSSRTLPLSGEYEITIRYDGAQITGNWASRSATGPNGASLDPRGTLTGTRNGSNCTWNDPSAVGGPPGVAYCGRGRWEWADDDVFNPQGHQVAIHVLTNQTRFVDFGERERQQAVAAAEQQRIAAERARQAAASPTRNSSNSGGIRLIHISDLLTYDERIFCNSLGRRSNIFNAQEVVRLDEEISEGFDSLYPYMNAEEIQQLNAAAQESSRSCKNLIRVRRNVWDD